MGVGGRKRIPVDCWENPTIDLVPQLKRNKDLVITVKDRTGEIGCLRFNRRPRRVDPRTANPL